MWCPILSKYSSDYFPQTRIFSHIISTQTSKPGNQHWYNTTIQLTDSIQMSSTVPTVAISMLIQDTLQEYVLHLVVMSLQSPSIWNSFSVLICVLGLASLDFKRSYILRIIVHLDSSDVSAWPDSDHVIFAEIPNSDAVHMKRYTV